MESGYSDKNHNLNRTTYPSKILVTCIMGLLIIIFFVVYIDVETPIIIISGSSMTPNILPGDIVLVKQEHISDIRTGDVIAIKSSSEVYQTSNNADDSYRWSLLPLIGGDSSVQYKTVVHRVVDVARDENNFVSLTTRGDFNFQNDDELITESHYIGKVYLVIPKAGNVINLLKNPVFVSIVIAIITTFYFYSKKSRS